jgi:hypothetical protein
MLKKLVQRDPIHAHARKVRAARRIGEGQKCRCGEARSEALLPGSTPTTCTECDRRRCGKSTEDQHHVAGKANDPTTIPVPANDHRARLSVDQCDWPKETLANRDGSPILTAAARDRGFVDTTAYLEERLRNAEMLECLDKYLLDKLGPRWWENSPLEQFAPKAKRDGTP